MATQMMGANSVRNATALTHAFQSMGQHAGLLMLLCTASQAFGATAPSEHPSMEIQRQRYANVCHESQSAELKKTLLVGRASNATQAWHIIDMILCGPKNHANKLTVKKLIKSRVKRIIESTGDAPEQKWVRASEELASQFMAGGRAWNADIDAGAKTISLQYYPDEACIRIVKLEYSGTKWIVYEFAEACD